MDTKLTLKLNIAVIEKAKEYARLHNTNLSSIVENYLQNITADDEQKDLVTPVVKSLSGIIKLPDNYNHKKDYSSFLITKYK